MKKNLFIFIFLACIGYSLQAMENDPYDTYISDCTLQAFSKCNHPKCFMSINNESNPIICHNCNSIDYCSIDCMKNDIGEHKYRCLMIQDLQVYPKELKHKLQKKFYNLRNIRCKTYQENIMLYSEFKKIKIKKNVTPENKMFFNTTFKNISLELKKNKDNFNKKIELEKKAKNLKRDVSEKIANEIN